MSLPQNFLHSPNALRDFVLSWEAGTLPKAEWTHAAHVAVAACYTAQSRETALPRMRKGVIRYNEAVGSVNSDHSGYHETLTRFWCAMIATLLGQVSDSWEAAVIAVKDLGHRRDLHRLYYSFDVVNSLAARREWVPPDLNGPYALD